MSESHPTPRSPRRWLRFGVRGVLALMVLVAIPLAWKGNRVRAQRLAVAEVQRGNGLVAYDYQERAEEEWREANRTDATRRRAAIPLYETPQPPGPAWIRRYLGDDFFAAVVEVEFDESDSERLPAVLPRLPELTRLGVKRGTDATLAPLRGLPHLRVLRLQGEFTPEGLAALQSLDALEELALDAPSLSERHIEALCAVPRERLRTLSLSAEDLTDEQLNRLLGRFTRLRRVSIQSRRITDQSLRSLAKCTTLEWLTVSGSDFSQAEADGLQSALPDCVITVGGKGKRYGP